MPAVGIKNVNILLANAFSLTTKYLVFKFEYRFTHSPLHKTIKRNLVGNFIRFSLITYEVLERLFT